MEIWMLMKLYYTPLIIILIDIFRRNICNGYITESNLCLENIATNLKHPTTVSTWPGGNKLVVSEHAGRIYLLTSDNENTRDSHKEMFLDISDRVLTSDAPAEERGLLSFTLDPEFTQNGYIYVCYSAPSAYLDHKTVISRFYASNLIKVNKDSEKVILEIEQPGRRQNGGQIFFGLDNYLYITTGDGGDLANKRFDKNSFLGKILRIDVRRELKTGYDIPNDNPFVGENNTKREIYAYGFKNPWRCTVDKGDPNKDSRTGIIICGDNGEEEPYEEIDIIHSGGRYGWMELSDSTCKTVKDCLLLDSKGLLPPNDIVPIYTYSHEEGQAVVGGMLYRGNNIKSLYGAYIYADFVQGSLHYLEKPLDTHKLTAGNIALQVRNKEGICVDISKKFFILGLSMDHDGEIIVMTTESLSNSSPSGALHRLGISKNLDSIKDEKTGRGNTAQSLTSMVHFVFVTAKFCFLVNLGFLYK